MGLPHGNMTIFSYLTIVLNEMLVGFLAFDLCRSRVVIRVFFIPATTANDLRLRRIFYPRFNPLHLFPILILEKEPVFPC